MKQSIIANLLMIFLFNCNSIKKETSPIVSKNKVENVKIENNQEQSKTYGIDISMYQGEEVSELHKEKDSLTFIICKATEGITYTDPEFSYNWKTIKEKSFLRGAYHFYRSNDDPTEQAQNFLNAIKDIKNTDIPPIIDFEQGGIDTLQSLEEIQKRFKSFINQIESNLKCKPIIYTDVNTGNKYLKDSFFAEYPLWIANYTKNNTPDVPVAWQDKGWVIWQRTATYSLDGETDDLDLFHGDLQDLKEFISRSWQ